MKILSLFDGISCGLLALKRAECNVERYYASEIDKYAMQISEKNFPDIIQVGDIRNLSFENGVLYTNNNTYTIGKIDLLIGGSPCQNFTFSGSKKGMTTKENVQVLTLEDYMFLKKQGIEFEGQSYLFWEYVRLLKEIKPKYFLLENVKMKQKWQDVITKALGVEPIRINSNRYSAQNRDRLYWTNIIDDTFIPKTNNKVLADIVDDKYDVEKYQLTKKHMDGFLRNYSNWKPCKLNEKSKPLLATYYKQPPHCPYIVAKHSSSGYRRLSPIECERLQTLPDNYTDGISDTQRYKCIGNGWTVDVIADIFSNLK